MKATEAVRLSNVVQRHGNIELLYKVNGHWFDKNGHVVDFNSLCNDGYVPLVPLKQYAVGDVVKVWEAIGSGKFFTLLKNGTPFKGDGKTVLFWNVDKWEEDNEWHPRILFQDCTIVPDPSIPPKPTIADLQFGTMFKATHLRGETWECVKGNNEFFVAKDYGSWGDSEFWTLTHIKNTDGEWEEV